MYTAENYRLWGIMKSMSMHCCMDASELAITENGVPEISNLDKG